MNEEARKLAREIAVNSIVTDALARFIEQTFAEVVQVQLEKNATQLKTARQAAVAARLREKAAEDARVSAVDRAARLEIAARAVVERWDTPQWKDVEPTAAVIERLRKELKGDG